MLSKNKSTHSKEKVMIIFVDHKKIEYMKPTLHMDETDRNRIRELRLSENNFFINEFNQSDSKKIDTNHIRTMRVGKKSLIENQSYLKEIDDSTTPSEKINKNYIRGISTNKFDVDEYQGLSYLNQKSSPGRSDDTNITEGENEVLKFVNKKSVDIDFRSKYKTEICKFWELNKECRYGNNCAFAHGIEDIRSKINVSTNYKTKKCKQFFDTGYCPYGSRCQFLHNELRKLSTPRPQTLLNVGSFSYSKILESYVSRVLFSQNDDREGVNKLRPRLKTFTLLTNNIYYDKNNKWNSSPYLIEVDGSNVNNEEIVSNNVSEGLVNLTIDSLISTPVSDSPEH